VWQYELLFCVDDSTDAAVMVVNSLIQKYPLVNACLFAGGLFMAVDNIVIAFLTRCVMSRVPRHVLAGCVNN